MKQIKILAWILVLLLATACLWACDDVGEEPSENNDPPSGNVQNPVGNGEIMITYYPDAGQAAVTVRVTGGFTLSPIPTKAGHEFLGLFDAPAGGSCIVNANGELTVTLAKSVTLYAQWKTKTYKLIFDPAEGELSRKEQTVLMGGAVVALPVPEREGFDFVGWQDQRGNMISEGSKVLDAWKTFTPESYSLVNDCARLTAVYTRRQITVTLDYRDGSYKAGTLTLNYGDVLTASSLPVEDNGTRRIVAWSIFANGTVPYADDAVEESFTLYAVWKNYQTVMMDDGMGNQTKAYVYEGERFDLNTYNGVVRPGYRVEGWYSNQGLTGSPVTHLSYGMAQTVFYAKWTPTVYTLTFDAVSTGKTIQPITYSYGSFVQLESLYREGYTFNGWCVTPDCSDPPMTAVTAEFFGDYTLYAKFTPDSYTVKLNPGKGTVSREEAQVSYESHFILPIPTRAGASFVGWYYLEDGVEVLCTDELGQSTKIYTFMEGKTLYARWKTVTLTVYYDSNGGTEVAAQTYGYGDPLKFPAPPTKTNLYFMGWYHGDLSEAYLQDSEVNSNLTLYAKWGDVDRGEVYGKCNYESILDTATEYNGNYYKIFNLTCTWEQARAYCEALGGHLVTITSIGEDAVCGQMYRANNVTTCYIGATDKDAEGVWTWVTGEKWGYNNFNTGEPNGGTGSNFGAYYIINGQTAYWDDTSGEHIFMCEWEEGDVAWVRENVGFLKSADELYNEAIYYAGHVYQVYNISDYDYAKQKQYCEKLGGRLATIESARENTVVGFLLKTAGIANAIFGATDRYQEGTWCWTDGRVIGYSNWNSGEPNNSSNAEHYAEVYATGGWNDVQGSGRAAFVCEWDYWELKQ
ncbi:MAG: hypothetical protein E7620_00080 [Ruminococcaceae bacterium]|nr:hypothetical protein [Oscillospiraceae bacterium]